MPTPHAPIPAAARDGLTDGQVVERRTTVRDPVEPVELTFVAEGTGLFGL